MSYAGLADSKGYVQVGQFFLHVEFMRSYPVGTIAAATGISEDWLVEQAKGVWAPLGLPWEKE